MGARKSNPQPGARPGRVACLGHCGQKFDSVDVTTNRICPECTRVNQREFIPRTVSGTVYVGDSPCKLSSDD